MFRRGVRRRKARNGWDKLNSIVLLLHIVLPVWMLAMMYTPSLTTPLLILSIILCLLLGVVYKVVRWLGTGKPVLYGFRTAALCSMLAVYVPFAIMCGFGHSKWMYPVKRMTYTHGVFGENHGYYDRLLPESLPKVCKNYSFRTQGSMVAQDYHPSSYLVFSTDKTALDAYAAYYEAQGFARSDDSGKYTWVMRMMKQNIADDAPMPEGTVFYYISDYYPKAVVLDYAEGRFMVLT